MSTTGFNIFFIEQEELEGLIDRENREDGEGELIPQQVSQDLACACINR